MKNLYIKYWNIWDEEAGDLMVYFNLIEEVNDHGDFGLKRHYLSRIFPKWDAIQYILKELRGGLK